MKIREHKGFTVDYNTETKRFEAYGADGKVTLYDSTENQLTDKIDASVKRAEKATKSKVFPIEAIFRFWNDLYKGRITSVADDGDLWVTYTKDGENKREKRSTRYATHDYFTITEANLALLNSHEKKDLAIAKLTEEMSAIRQSLKDPIDIDEIVRHLNN